MKHPSWLWIIVVNKIDDGIFNFRERGKSLSVVVCLELPSRVSQISQAVAKERKIELDV